MASLQTPWEQWVTSSTSQRCLDLHSSWLAAYAVLPGQFSGTAVNKPCSTKKKASGQSYPLGELSFQYLLTFFRSPCKAYWWFKPAFPLLLPSTHYNHLLNLIPSGYQVSSLTKKIKWHANGKVWGIFITCKLRATHRAGPMSQEKIHNYIKNTYKARKLTVSYVHFFLYIEESDFQCSQTDPFGIAF